jgi:iron(III) transport system substrate-binding protein
MIAAPARECRLFARTLMLALLLLAACGKETAPEETARGFEDSIVVFTTIPEGAVAPLMGAYTAQTGSRIVLIQGDAGALWSEHSKNRRPQPDLFIASNIAELTNAAERSVLRPTRSETISRLIPAELRHPEHLWVSLSTRARAIVYNARLLHEDELRQISSYTSLADTSWRGRLCLSSSIVAGNRSLIARLINDLGLREAEMVVRGWRANLAGAVHADDPKLLQALAAGECAVGIADSSRIVAFLDAERHTDIAPHWFAAAGVTHIDASGGGVTRHAGNPDGAVKLLEWLTSREANARFAAALLEFSANPRSSTHTALTGWPGLDAVPVNIANLGYLLEDATELAERARYP